MKITPKELRKILSSNIKKHREVLGLSQERLAELAEISTIMVKDIEGCRTWVSDKTIINLAFALKTDIYRLLMPTNGFEEEIFKTTYADLEKMTTKMRQDLEINISNTLNLWEIKKNS